MAPPKADRRSFLASGPWTASSTGRFASGSSTDLSAKGGTLGDANPTGPIPRLSLDGKGAVPLKVHLVTAVHEVRGSVDDRRVRNFGRAAAWFAWPMQGLRKMATGSP